jgi:predicted GNAT superfamily acetyltransferase
MESESIDEIYLDDLVVGLFDLNTILSSLAGISPLTLLVKGNIATVENYIKHLTEQIKIILKRFELKASKTKAIISWTFDPNEMRGDRLEIISRLESRLKDYVGDVERSDSIFDFYSSEKKLIVLSCSKTDLEKLNKNNPNSEIIIVKATPLIVQPSIRG